MKKIRFISIYCLSCLFAVLLCGCGDSGILTEKMQTVAWDKEAERETKVSGFLNEEASCYAYRNLNEAEVLWYHDIAECLSGMSEEIRLNEQGFTLGLGETDVDRIFQCVLIDHPELFYVDGYTFRKYTRNNQTVAIEFSGNYSMDAKQALARSAEIEAQIQEWLAEASGFTDDYEKVKYVYETVIYNTEYDSLAPDNQNIYSVFVNHRSVCQGYAKAVQYLLERLGIECALVFGTVEGGEGHAWNLVKVNGDYYYVDATWGDPSYQIVNGETTEEYLPEISYDYLCITTEQLLRTHVIGDYVPMPLCEAEKNNYYIRQGVWFSAYDKEQMQTVIGNFLESGNPDVTIKCADEETFQQILFAMVDEQEIFDYLPDGYDSIGYTQNEKQLSMTFWVTNK